MQLTEENLIVEKLTLLEDLLHLSIMGKKLLTQMPNIHDTQM